MLFLKRFLSQFVFLGGQIFGRSSLTFFNASSSLKRPWMKSLLYLTIIFEETLAQMCCRKKLWGVWGKTMVKMVSEIMLMGLKVAYTEMEELVEGYWGKLITKKTVELKNEWVKALQENHLSGKKEEKEKIISAQIKNIWCKCEEV